MSQLMPLIGLNELLKARVGNLFSIVIKIRMIYGICGISVIRPSKHFIWPELKYWMAYMFIYLPKQNTFK